MEKIEDENLVSNHKYVFDPFSMSIVWFENELILNDIYYIKQSISVTRPVIKFTFYEKDIELVNSIFSKIEKESLEHAEKRREIKKQNKTTPESKQRKLAIYILIVILILILFSIML